MSDFFSNQISEAPNLNVLEHLFLMIIWFFMLHLCFRCYQKDGFILFFGGFNLYRLSPFILGIS